MAEDNKAKSQAQEQNPPVENPTDYFARIPYALFDARESGEITPSMFLAMLWLYKWADWSTGSVAKMCAERLCWATDDEIARRTFQDALNALASAHWIISHCPRRTSRPYRVDICNYVALSGAHKGEILNPSEIKTWRKPRKSVRADDRAGSAQGVREDAAQSDSEENSEANSEASAPTMRVTTENNTRDSSGDFGSRENIPPLFNGNGEKPGAPEKQETAKPEIDYPPQVTEIVDVLKGAFKYLASQHHPKPIPASEFTSEKKFYVERIATFIPYKDACELYEKSVQSFVNAQPKPKPPPPPLPDVSLRDVASVRDDVLTALKDNPDGLNTRELVSRLFGLSYDGDPSDWSNDWRVSHNYYRAQTRIVMAVSRLRKSGYSITTSGTDSKKKKYVLERERRQKTKVN